MTDKSKEILTQLELVKKAHGDKKEKTALELFYEADQMLEKLGELIEDAEEVYNDAKDVLFAEAGLLKESETVPQLKG